MGERRDSRNRGYFRFCPTCGVTTHYAIDAMPGVTAIPLGTFESPDFAPAFSVWEMRKLPWVTVDAGEHWD